MPRQVYKIEAQISILIKRQKDLSLNSIQSWHALENRIKSLKEELVKAKQFEFEAK